MASIPTIIIDIIIIIIIITFITLMPGVYNCLPKTNYTFRVYSVAAVLYLQFVLPEMFL